MTRRSLPEILSLNTYWVGHAFLWNSLHILLLPAILLNYVPESQKNTYLGLLTFLGLLVAMAVQPLSGALSDRWVSRWGRRRPLLLIGVVGVFACLIVLALAGGLAVLAVAYIGLQLCSNIAQGPAQGLLRDRVPVAQMGVGSGVKNFMDMLGLILASLVMGRLVPPDIASAAGPVGLMAAILAVASLITLLGGRETPSIASSPAGVDASPVQPPLDRRLTRAFGWLLASRFVFLWGLYLIQGFAHYYVRDVLRPPNPVQLIGDLLATITLGMIVFALLGGRLGDRLESGHHQVLFVAGGLSAAGYLLLMQARTPLSLLLLGGFLGIGLGLFLTANWALANQLAPLESAGKYLGLTNLATAGAAAAARLGGPLIDLGNNLDPGAFWGYKGMFLLAAVVALASVFLVRRITAVPASDSAPLHQNT